MGVSDFSLIVSEFWGDKFFSLSLIVFGGQIGDVCDFCFVGIFVFFIHFFFESFHWFFFFSLF